GRRYSGSRRPRTRAAERAPVPPLAGKAIPALHSRRAIRKTHRARYVSTWTRSYGNAWLESIPLFMKERRKQRQDAETRDQGGEDRRDRKGHFGPICFQPLQVLPVLQRGQEQ